MAALEEENPQIQQQLQELKKKKRKRNRPKKDDQPNNPEQQPEEQEEEKREEVEMEQATEAKEELEEEEKKRKKKKKKMEIDFEELKKDGIKVKLGEASGIMSGEAFTSLGLSEKTLNAINDMGFVNMTQDWIVQYDPPDEPKEYIHRVGRTARGEGAKGNALLFLIPEELLFLRYLKAAKVPVKEYEYDTKKLANVQSHLEKLVSNNYYLNKSAKDAYRSYILAYNSHSMKDIFNVHRLDLQAVAASFCFATPPPR